MSALEVGNGVFKQDRPALSLTDRPVMALTTINGDSGLVRVIDHRNGRVDTPGFEDRSSLHYAVRKSDFAWELGDKITIKGLDRQIGRLMPHGARLLGLEDPDVVTDAGRIHAFFTLAFRLENGDNWLYLGHAAGWDMRRLSISMPALSPVRGPKPRFFKEAAIGPMNRNRVRLNLVESNDSDDDGRSYSTLALAEASNLTWPWEYREQVLHPKDLGYSWCAEHLSPCRLLSREFVDAGDLMVGILNGREESTGERFGRFRPGLFLFNPETGEIPWVDEQPLFDDPAARNIVFASEFRQTDERSGVLYAHIDDAYINAYHLPAAAITARLPRA